MVRSALLAAAFVSVTLLASFPGCSSSSNTVPPTDGGGGTDSAAHADTGGGSSSGGNDSGGGGDSSHDAATTCPDNATYTTVPYATVTAHRGACHPADLSGFLAACGAAGTNATCQPWQSANVGDAGTACGNCIFDKTNTGATWTDQHHIFGANYGGCIQLTDAANGAACAAALDNIEGCVGFECDSCTSNNSFSACQTTVTAAGAVCAQYATAFQTVCATDNADGGAASTCSPGKATMNFDLDFTYMIDLICGTVDGG
jgi:hypothetical protein